MAKVLDLISGSLRLIGAIASGETASAAEVSDALYALNNMIATWSNENLIVYSRIREAFPLIPNQQTYTFGLTGDFNSDKPIEIERAGIEMLTQTPPVEIPMEIINQDQWAETLLKGTQSFIPRRLYIEMTFPLATLNVWPIPQAVNNLAIYSKKQLTQFASSTTTLSLPPGYEEALRYGLAIKLCPEYGKQLDPVVAAGFAEAKESIKRTNIRPVYLNCDEATLNQRKPFSVLRGD